MSGDNIYHNDEFGKLIKKSQIEISNPDFDVKLMDRIHLIDHSKRVNLNNLRWSWAFLVISVILLPVGFSSVMGSFNLSNSSLLGKYIIPFEHLIMPTGIIFFAIIVLVQLDNLLQISWRKSLY